MSANPPDDPSFAPNPDIDLNLNAAAAAYAVDKEWSGRVQGFVADDQRPANGLFGGPGGLERSENRLGFQHWQAFLRKIESLKGE